MKRIFFFLLSILMISSCSLDMDNLLNSSKQPIETTEVTTNKPLQDTDTPKTISTTLNFAVDKSPEFQPHSETSNTSKRFMNFVYDPLFYVDSELNAINALATSVEITGNRILVYLRDGVTWHDGSSFSSADVVYSINLIINGLSTYSCPEIIASRAISNNCVEITLFEQVAYPQTFLTFPIVKNGSPQNMTKPIGTGAYKLSSQGEFNSFTFVPNESYYGEVPVYQKIKLTVARNKEQLSKLFDVGESDMMYIEHDNLSAFNMRTNATIMNFPTNEMVYLGFNTKNIPSGVRRAIYYALNKADITNKIYSQTAEFSNVPFIPSSIVSDNGYDKNKYSIQTAETEMKNLGYLIEDGFYEKNGKVLTLHILVEDTDEYGALYDVISEKLNNFGIKCTNTKTSYFYDRLVSYDFDVFLGSNDISTNMNVLLGANNIFQYENTEFRNSASSINTMAKAFEIFEKDVPIVPICFKKSGISISNAIDTTLSPSYIFPFYGAI